MTEINYYSVALNCKNYLKHILIRKIETPLSLTVFERQQYILRQLLNVVKEFELFGDQQYYLTSNSTIVNNIEHLFVRLASTNRKEAIQCNYNELSGVTLIEIDIELSAYTLDKICGARGVLL